MCHALAASVPRRLAASVPRRLVASVPRLAYVGKGRSGRYEPFLFGTSLTPDEVEISDEVFVITADEAKKHVEPPHLATLIIAPSQAPVEPGKKQTLTSKGLDQHGRDIEGGKATWMATGASCPSA